MYLITATSIALVLNVGAYSASVARGPNGGTSPVWSPDGRQVIFLSATPNTPVNVWAVEVGRGRPRQITHLGARWLSWGPNGQRLYCRTTRGGKTCFYIVDLSNGDEVPALEFLPENVRAVVLSPNKKHVAYVVPHDQDRDLWVADLNGAKQRRLTEGMDVRSVAWSPDSTTIAFDVGGIVGESTYVVEASGTAEPKLVFPAIGSYPSWSPDGSWLVVLGMHTAILVNADGTGSRRLHISHANRGHLDWSPDGTMLAYASPVRDGVSIAVVEVRSGDIRYVSSGWATAGVPRWSPDGRSLVYEAARKGGYGSDVYVVDILRGRQRRLTATAPSFWDPRWCPGAQALFYISNATHDGRFYLCQKTSTASTPHAVLPVDPRQPLQISWPTSSSRGVVVVGKKIWLLSQEEAPECLLETEHPTWASLSPDGKTLAYVKWQRHRPSIVLRRVPRRKETKMVPPPEAGTAYTRLVWTPDGRELVFWRGNELCKVSRETGMVSVLVPAPIDEGQWTVFSPACSPDGRWIAYARVNMGDEQRFQINLVRPEGGSPQTIATGEVVAEPGLYADPLASPYAWSPDGSKFVFCLEKRGAPLLQIVSVGDTGVEGQPRVLATNAAYPMWGADGAEIIYTAFDGCREQLRTIRIAGNRSRVLKLKRALPLGVGGG